MKKVRVIIVHKLKGVVEAINSVYKVLSDPTKSVGSGIEFVEVDQGWFIHNAKSGWNLNSLVKGIYAIVEKLANIEGYRVNKLLKDLQGVTTGSNELFVFDKNKWEEIEQKYGLSKSGLVYDCIAGEDIKPWSITINKKILFPYKEYRDESGKLAWTPAFMTEKGDALNFIKVMAPDESINDDVRSKLNKRVAYNIVKPELVGVARYLVDNYDTLRNRKYEGRRIEEYAGVWYGFHRPRSPEILRTPNIVTPRIVKEPRFALNERMIIPLDNVIVLVPREDKDSKLEDLRTKLENILDTKLTLKDVMLYILSILNSRISSAILKVKATRIRGDYYTIDEKYLSSIIIPEPTHSDKDLLREILDAVRRNKHYNAEKLVLKLYAKHAKLSDDDLDHLSASGSPNNTQ